MEDMRNSYKILVEKLKERDYLLGRQRHRWEDNIRMDLREDGKVWNGFIRFKIGASGGFL
jgi:hypothetical protein